MREAMRLGMAAHQNGAAYFESGDFPCGSPAERAWRAGWEIACADAIASGREPTHAMPEQARVASGGRRLPTVVLRAEAAAALPQRPVAGDLTVSRDRIPTTGRLCEPPPEHSGIRWHWLRHINAAEPRPMRYDIQANPGIFPIWHDLGTGQWAYLMGWRYVAPCIIPENTR